MNKKIDIVPYSKEEVLKSALEYFDGDELASSTWYNKYCLKDREENPLEFSPDDMHKRMASKFGEIEEKYEHGSKDELRLKLSEYGYNRGKLDKDKIYSLFKDFKYVIPAGSVMFGLGNPLPVSLSNCFVIDGPKDSLDDIFRVCNEQSQLMKRRGGCIEENTSVIIKDKGNISIKDVKIGDYILSFNIQTKQDEWKKVLDWYYTDVNINDQIELTTNRGTKLKTSKKHPLLCLDNKDGYVFKNFNSGELLNSTNKQPNLNKEIELNDDNELNKIGWLIGCHMGDGSSEYREYKKYSKCRTRITGDNENVIKEYCNIYNHLSNSDATYFLSKNKRYKSKVWEYSCAKDSSKTIYNTYFDNQIGKKTYTWDIPKYVYDNNLMIPFISGLIDADGYITNSGRIDISICSKYAINSITKYLSSHGQLYSCTKKISKRKNEQPIYSLRIYRSNDIYNLILKYIKHDAKYDKMLNASLLSQSSSVALTENEISFIKNYDYKSFSNVKLYQLLKHNSLNVFRNKKIALSALLLLRDNDIINSELYNEIMSRDKIIVCQEDNNIKYNYIDISVEDNNNYYAGEFGFINIHNCGFDISSLRPYSATVNNSAKSSTGAVSFMDLFSHVTNTISQMGRRGALMLSISIKHPDSKEFIEKKQDLSKVTGANISVQIDDEFMEAVKNNKLYLQKYPIDLDDAEFIEDDVIYELDVLHRGKKENTYFKYINAKELWDTVIKCAWSTAEPGIIFQTNHYNYSPDGVYESFRGSCTNPCQPSWATILTPNGIKTFAEINVGDVIWSKEGWTNVVRKEYSGVKDVYEYRTTAGSFYGTDTHRIISKGEKIEVKEAETIDVIGGFHSSNCEINCQDIMDGLVLGDGSVHKCSNNLVYLCIGENDTDYFESEIKHLIGKHRDSMRYFAYEVNTTISYDELPNTYLRTVPERFFKGNFNKIKGFLRGLYSANGSVVNKRVTLKTSSKQLRDEVQIMLSAIGIRSYYTINKPKDVEFNNGIYTCKKSYDINISSDRDIFFTEVGFIQKYKMQLLSNTLSCIRKNEKNHNIISSELISNEDVYNITVDNNTHTYWTGGLNVSNCGEVYMREDSCRLIHLNLTSFIDNPYSSQTKLNETKLYEITYEAMLLGDDLVDLEIEAISKIMDKIANDGDKNNNEYKLYERLLAHSLEGRRCGLGFTGLADMIAMLGLKYDSSDGLKVINQVMRIMFVAEMDAQIDMSILRGSFPSYNKELELSGNEWYDFLKSDFKEKYDKMLTYGRRNISFNTVAPTGTVALMAKTSSGIEPIFMPFYTRRRKCMNGNDKVDFIDQNGEKYTEFVVVHPNLLKWAENNFDIDLNACGVDKWNEIYEQSPWYKSTANDINWERRVELQGIVQKYITHSISSTVNLPESVSQEEVSNIYLKSWASKLKGITVYRDKCRSGVLVSSDKKDETKKDNKICISNESLTVRPKSLPCKIFRFNNKGEKWVGVIGMKDEKPYEIFTGLIDKLNIPNWLEDGFIVRNKENKEIDGEIKLISRYDLCYYDKDGFKVCVEGLSRTFNSEYWNYAKLISGLLRHNMPITYVIKVISSLNLDESTINTWKNGVIRTLRKFNNSIDNHDKFEKCPNCGGRLLNEGGCVKCLDCDYSKCG